MAAKVWETLYLQFNRMHEVFVGSFRIKSGSSLDVESLADLTGSLLCKLRNCFFWDPDMH